MPAPAPAFARPAPAPVIAGARGRGSRGGGSVGGRSGGGRAHGGGPGSVVAPLGGVVFSIDVPLGHAVAIGDRVATIEAMKMKTEVMSKLAGNVSHIAAKANDSVETGQVLMTIG